MSWNMGKELLRVRPMFIHAGLPQQAAVLQLSSDKLGRLDKK